VRAWAAANAGVLTAYLAACIEGLRWILDPANNAEARPLIAERLNVPADIAAEILAVATDSTDGLAKDAVFDLEGLKTVLKLRTAFEGGNASPPEKYFDLTWYRRALAAL
jgi:hypothetical protein